MIRLKLAPDFELGGIFLRDTEGEESLLTKFSQSSLVIPSAIFSDDPLMQTVSPGI